MASTLMHAQVIYTLLCVTSTVTGRDEISTGRMLVVYRSRVYFIIPSARVEGNQSKYGQSGLPTTRGANEERKSGSWAKNKK